jgi:hypothetical protein
MAGRRRPQRHALDEQISYASLVPAPQLLVRLLETLS